MPKEPRVTLVVPDEAQSETARGVRRERGIAPLATVDELLAKDRATLRPGWASAAGAGSGEPDRGDSYIS